MKNKNSDRCFGIIANMDFLLVCTYEESGENPELVILKKDNNSYGFVKYITG